MKGVTQGLGNWSRQLITELLLLFVVYTTQQTLYSANVDIYGDGSSISACTCFNKETGIFTHAYVDAASGCSVDITCQTRKLCNSDVTQYMVERTSVTIGTSSPCTVANVEKSNDIGQRTSPLNFVRYSDDQQTVWLGTLAENRTQYVLSSLSCASRLTYKPVTGCFSTAAATSLSCSKDSIGTTSRDFNVTEGTAIASMTLPSTRTNYVGAMIDEAKQPSKDKEVGCTNVSVQGDATYCIKGKICGSLQGWGCPQKGQVAVSDCRPGLPSYISNLGKCIAPVDSRCIRIFSRAWGCVF